MNGSGTLFFSLPFVGLVNIYVMCADSQLFFDFEHKVLIGFAIEGHGLRFPSLLMRTIAPS